MHWNVVGTGSGNPDTEKLTARQASPNRHGLTSPHARTTGPAGAVVAGRVVTAATAVVVVTLATLVTGRRRTVVLVVDDGVANPTPPDCSVSSPPSPAARNPTNAT